MPALQGSPFLGQPQQVELDRVHVQLRNFRGLEAFAIEEIEIKWPNAKQTSEVIKNVPVDTLVKIKEGAGKQ